MNDDDDNNGLFLQFECKSNKRLWVCTPFAETIVILNEI